MPEKPNMTPDRLANAGRALYGERWQTSLAVDLRVSDRTMRRWLVGDSPIPDSIDDELRALLIKRMNEMGGMIGYSVNPSDYTVFHYPTAACFRYDEAGNLTLLNPAMIAHDDVALITQGAEEALRQDRERDPRIKFMWADRNGRGGSTMEMCEDEYKGYVISYPRVRIDSARWTVNLASNSSHLQAKLGPSAEVFNDPHSLDGAIAQAKRRVDELN
jgi:hypothetical protein